MKPTAAPVKNAPAPLYRTSTISLGSAAFMASALTGNRPALAVLNPFSAVMTTITVAMAQAVLFFTAAPLSEW
jgi:hypothetical protein